MKREELLKNKGYWISKIQIDLYNQLKNYMTEKNINQSKLAKELGVSKGYVSQVLNGDFNHRISTLVELSLAINKVPEISFKDLDQFISKDVDGFKPLTWHVFINPSDTSKIETFEESELTTGESKPINIDILEKAVANLS